MYLFLFKVLQRDVSARVWGIAGNSGLVTVVVSDNGAPIDTQNTTVAANAPWYIDLAPHAASPGAYSSIQIISGDGDHVTLNDIAWGDVYVCGKTNSPYDPYNSYNPYKKVDSQIWRSVLVKISIMQQNVLPRLCILIFVS